MEVVVWIPRMLHENDYETLTKWWDTYEFPVPPREFLPDNGKCGIMLEDSNGKQYCAGFVYFTNSGVSWIELIISNPCINDKELRKKMLNQLIVELENFAKHNHSKWIFTSVKNESLGFRFNECGFITGSVGTTEMIKKL